MVVMVNKQGFHNNRSETTSVFQVQNRQRWLQYMVNNTYPKVRKLILNSSLFKMCLRDFNLASSSVVIMAISGKKVDMNLRLKAVLVLLFGIGISLLHLYKNKS